MGAIIKLISKIADRINLANKNYETVFYHILMKEKVMTYKELYRFYKNMENKPSIEGLTIDSFKVFKEHIEEFEHDIFIRWFEDKGVNTLGFEPERKIIISNVEVEHSDDLVIGEYKISVILNLSESIKVLQYYDEVEQTLGSLTLDMGYMPAESFIIRMSDTEDEISELNSYVTPLRENRIEKTYLYNDLAYERGLNQLEKEAKN
jgi:hypothetical protein